MKKGGKWTAAGEDEWNFLLAPSLSPFFLFLLSFLKWNNRVKIVLCTESLIFLGAKCFSGVWLCSPMDCSPPGSLSVRFSIGNGRSGLPSPPQGIFDEINPHLLGLLPWQVGFLPLAPPGKPLRWVNFSLGWLDPGYDLWKLSDGKDFGIEEVSYCSSDVE